MYTGKRSRLELDGAQLRDVVLGMSGDADITKYMDPNNIDFSILEDFEH